MAIRYKELYGKELQEVMKKEFGGDLGLALRWLAMPADQAEAKMIKEAAKGIGSQVNIIWSIMVARTNEEMERLKKTYFDMYTKGELGQRSAYCAVPNACRWFSFFFTDTIESFFPLLDLGKLMAHELTGDMERLIFTCMQASEEVYDPQFHTADKALEDAETIHKMGQGRWGTNERGIFKIVCASPKEHLENVSL